VGPDGVIVPALAASYNAAPDGLAYTFNLVTTNFHDGTPLDSADVKATLERIMAESTASPKRSEFTSITGIDTPDAATVVVHLSEPRPALLASLASGWGAIL